MHIVLQLTNTVMLQDLKLMAVLLLQFPKAGILRGLVFLVLYRLCLFACLLLDFFIFLCMSLLPA